MYRKTKYFFGIIITINCGELGHFSGSYDPRPFSSARISDISRVPCGDRERNMGYFEAGKEFLTTELLGGSLTRSVCVFNPI